MKPWMLAAALFVLALAAGLAIELWLPRAHVRDGLDPNAPLTDDECGAFLNQVMKLQFTAADEAARRAGKPEEQVRQHRAQVLREIQSDPHRLELVQSCRERTPRQMYVCVMQAHALADLAACDSAMLARPDAG